MCLVTGSALKTLTLPLEQLVSGFITHKMKEFRQRIGAALLHSSKCFYVIDKFIKIHILKSPEGCLKPMLQNSC